MPPVLFALSSGMVEAKLNWNAAGCPSFVPCETLGDCHAWKHVGEVDGFHT